MGLSTWHDCQTERERKADNLARLEQELAKKGERLFHIVCGSFVLGGLTVLAFVFYLR